MALQVIGAGFGRTGTKSLKAALERLGFDPCYHMVEVLPSPERAAQWVDLAHGGTPDWDHIFAGYSAAVDWPSAFFWRELAAHYPEAKIILSLRPSDEWFASMDRTILVELRKRTPGAVGFELITKGVFADELDDPDHIIAAYERNNDAVRAEIDPDRLLVYRPGDGWGPLCAFLGAPVPDEPYPHTNTRKNFAALVAGLEAKRDATSD